MGFFLETPIVVAQKSTTKHQPKSEIKTDSSAIALHHFNSNFKQKYKGNAFTYEFKTPEKNGWDRFKEAVAAFFRKLFNISDGKTSMQIATYFIRILAFAIISYVFYLLIKSLMNKEGQWILGKDSSKKVIDSYDLEKNLQSVDFEKLIQKSLLENEYRLSIRYYYLWVLKQMTSKNIIDWDPEKTNSDYLNEIKNEALKAHFGYLSYLYNYTWYGAFDLDEAGFVKAKLAFEKVIKSIANE